MRFTKPVLLWAMVVVVVALFLWSRRDDGRYKGFLPEFAESAREKERKISKAEVIAATKKLKLGMTNLEVAGLLVKYSAGPGQIRLVDDGCLQLDYLIHGILVDMKSDAKSFDADEFAKGKLLWFEVRTFKGW